MHTMTTRISYVHTFARIPCLPCASSRSAPSSRGSPVLFCFACERGKEKWCSSDPGNKIFQKVQQHSTCWPHLPLVGLCAGPPARLPACLPACSAFVFGHTYYIGCFLSQILSSYNVQREVVCNPRAITQAEKMNTSQNLLHTQQSRTQRKAQQQPRRLARARNKQTNVDDGLKIADIYFCGACRRPRGAAAAAASNK